MTYQLSTISKTARTNRMVHNGIAKWRVAKSRYVETITLTDVREYRLKLYQVPIPS